MLKKHLVMISLIIVLALASIAAAPAAAKYSFAGVWKGAGIEARITPYNNVMFIDNTWAACGGGKVKGTGYGIQTNKSTMVASLKMKCVGTGVVVARNYKVTFTVKPAAQSLSDSLGGTYTLFREICR